MIDARDPRGVPRRRAPGKSAWALLLALALGPAACTSTEGATPLIDSLDPSSGPSGTVVVVSGTALGLDGDLRWDGAPEDAQGGDTRLLFTVPYGATTGSHDVTVVFDGTTSNAKPFNVTSTVSAPTPAIDGFAVSYYTLGRAGVETAMNLILFGTGLDTNSVVMLDGSDVRTFHPARPLGWLLDALATGYVMQGAPVERFNTVVAARLTEDDGTLPALGSAHTVQVRNGVTGTMSNTLDLTIPGRRALVEVDRIDATNVVWLPSAVWRTNRLNTAGRLYSPAGLLLDLRLDETVADPRSGGSFSDADVLNFFNANTSLRNAVYQDEWYFHVSLLSTRVESAFAVANGLVTLGRIFDTQNREGMTVFVANSPNDNNYLFTLVHEMGHGFNLTHCEGDAVLTFDAAGAPTGATTLGTTVMNQTRFSAADWGFQFTAASETHLTDHPLNEVQPGAGNLAFNSASRQEGACAY